MTAETANSHQPPFAEFGIIARVFIALASSVLVFSAVACVTILSMLAYMSITGHAVDFSLSYRFTGLIAGAIMLLVASVWVVWVGIYRIQHPARKLD